VKTMISRRQLVVRSLALLATTALVRPARAEAPAPAGEPPFLEPLIADGKLPPLSERLPKSPLVTNMIERGRTLGQYGGDMRTLVAKARDLRYITVCGYTRLV
jgi:peptide/nickel transport system substrate-binding protein